MPEPSVAGALTQSGIGLLVVFGLIAAAAWVLKRLGPGRSAPGGLLRTVASLPTGPKERIAVIEVGGTWLVVGITAAQITLLASMPRGESPSAAHAAPPGATAVPVAGPVRGGAP